jgi:ABC-2 type transport system permease protein
MLKTLIKLQFQKALARYTANSSNKKKNGKKSSFNSPAVYLALLAFVGVVFAFMFYNMFSMMAPMLATSGFSWLYFLYVMGASFVISTIGCIFLSLSQLYEAKDNELLLSMPIPPRSILFCRMLPLYAQNLLFCALVQVPAFAAYATNASVSVSLVVSQIVILLLVPLLSLSVSCILGWLIAFVTSRTRHKNVVTIVFSLVFFALYFYLYYQAEDLVKTLAANSIGKVQKKIYTRGRNFQLGITRNRCRSVDCGNGCAYRYGGNPHKCVGCCQLLHLRCIAHHTLHNVNSVSFFYK